MNVSYRHPGPFAAIGLLAAFAFAVIFAVAANADSSWIYGESMISDLGVSDVQLSADLFNYGCLIVGVLLFVFGVGKAACEFGCNRASGCMLAIAAIFLILIGYIHSDFGNGNTHEAIAILLGLMRSNVWITTLAMFLGKALRYIVLLYVIEGAVALL